MLCTEVPVVGRLQARRERRRGLQVPGGVIKASANIVGMTGSVCERRILFCGEGYHLPFIDQGDGDLPACRTV
jgi:hypothetical protein